MQHLSSCNHRSHSTEQHARSWCSAKNNRLRILSFRRSAVEFLEWQEPLQVIKYPDPRLRAPNARIAKFDDKLKELAQKMFQIMYQ